MIVYLLSYPGWTTKNLSLKLNRQTRSTKELIKEIISDAEFFLNKKISIELSLSGEIIVSEKNPAEILSFFYSLKLAYLEEVHEYKLIHLFLQKNTLSMVDISANLFLSHSYIRRIIKKMNIFFSMYNFQIKKEKRRYRIAGDELAIRLFLYVLMKDTYHSLPWPYTNKDLPQEVNLQQPLHILLSILNIRKSQKNSMPSLNIKSHWVVSQMKQVYNFIPELKQQQDYFKNNFKEIITEDYFIFFTHIYAPQTIPKDKKISLGEIFYNTPESVSLLPKTISCKILKEFHLNYSNEKKYLLTYYLTILACFHEITQRTPCLFEKIIFPPLQYSCLFERPQEKRINHFLHNIFIEENQLNFLQNAKLQKCFCRIISTILEMERETIIRIYIHFSTSLIGQNLIQTRLEAIYNSDTVRISTCISEADLIVTDSLNFNQKNEKEFIYFNTILDKNQWEILLHKINKLILAKRE